MSFKGDKQINAYNVEQQIPHSIDYSNLNKQEPWINQKVEIMVHMTFTYGEECDSEKLQYCLR